MPWQVWKLSKKIDIGDGFFALVDAEDFARASLHTWRIRPDGYVMRTYTEDDRTKHELLHRFILRAKESDDVNYKNGDRLDCRKRNLRIATAQQICFARKPKNGRPWKGVSQHRKKWKARIKINGEHRYIGSFDTPEEAARAYDAEAMKFFGKFAYLNFPPP